MSATVVSRSVPCALCSGGDDVELYPATVRDDDFNPSTFSARRSPDRIHYRMVRCRGCGLVRSDPVADQAVVGALYRSSRFDYHDELPNLVRTYGRQLGRLAAGRHSSSALAEIGCGSGFVLAEARRQGFSRVVGVEPSEDAVGQAEPSVASSIVCDVLRPGVLAPEAFDVVCLFQVLDHLPDPRSALDLCRSALKPGGALLVFNHNVRAVSARMLGCRSPIVDVEHTFLFDPRTLSELCRSVGLEVERARPAWNWCSVRHLLHLAPLPPKVRTAAVGAVERVGIAGASLPLPLGNLCVVARKPPSIRGGGPA